MMLAILASALVKRVGMMMASNQNVKVRDFKNKIIFYKECQAKCSQCI